MIQSILIENFLGYNRLHIKNLAPINVVMGKNDSGKTGLLKLLYAITKTVEGYSRRIQNDEVLLKRLLAEKMLDTFQPGKKGLGELVSKGQKEKLSVEVKFQHDRLDFQERLYFSFGESTTNTIVDGQNEIHPISEHFRCLFIPAKEVLTSLKAIRTTREFNQIPGFDDTYLDLIRALVVPTQKGNFTDELKSVNKELEDLFEGKVEQVREDDFVFRKGNTEFPMALTAEGIKKIGILTTLIRNRQLNANAVLFFDEPETTLHPEAIRSLMNMVMHMAKAGIQVFMATHSYFVIKQLAIASLQDDIRIMCLNLRREAKGISCETTELKDGILPKNDIISESLEMLNDELKMQFV